MKRTLRFLWRWSLVVTVPVTGVFLFWLIATAERYFMFAVRYDASPAQVTLRDVGRSELRHLLIESWLSWTAPLRGFERPSELRTVNLFASESDLDKLGSNLPHSGFDYVDGSMYYDGTVRKVELRYRGDFIHHWGFFKKSWRVKVKKGHLFEGLRRFNLIAPKFHGQLNNYLSYRLASRLGLIAPRTELVNVNMNGRPTGVHVLVEQLEESTIREAGSMPGDLYSGELIARDRYFGTDSMLFHHPRLWEKMAVNNHFDEASMAPLEAFIALLHEPDSEEKHERLLRMIDVDAWGRFLAFEVLSQTFHYNWNHNWRLYYDPWRTCFVPVVWDPNGWAPQFMPRGAETAILDVIECDLHRELLENADVLRRRHEVMRDFFGSGDAAQFLEEVDRTVETATPEIERDPNLVSSDPDLVVVSMRELAAGIRRVFGQVERGFLGKAGDLRYAVGEDGVLKIGLAGRRPVRRIVLRYESPLTQTPSVRLRWWMNDEPREVDVSGTVRIGHTEAVLELPLVAQFERFTDPRASGPRETLRVEDAYYELEIRGGDDVNEPLELLVDRGETQLEASIAADDVPRRSFHDMYRIASDRPARGPSVWSGNVEIASVVEIDDDLVIRPGTTVKFAPGAAIILRGRLHAAGTVEEPIRFVPAEPGQAPWGTFALKGPGADGSILRCCLFEGGSGVKQPLQEYSSMFSIHDVDRVTVTWCLFRDNQVVDDQVHGVYCSVRFVNCIFMNAPFDAVDLDISRGEFIQCRFQGNGNDSMDLMTSEAFAVACHYIGSGDKGISVGEDTRALVMNSRFVGNQIGIQAKDRSVAVLHNVDMMGNRVAMDAYKKNWRYGGGGMTFVYKSHFGADQAITLDRYSDTAIFDSYVDRSIALDPRVELRVVDSQTMRGAKHPRPFRFEAEQTSTVGLFPEGWSEGDTQRRGAFPRGATN